MASYHVARDGKEIGIFEQEVLSSKVADGTVRVTDLCWTSGMDKWVGVGQVLSTVGGETPLGGGSASPDPVWSTPTGGGARPPMPANHLVWSILATILCCLPFGIVAIVYSSKVEPRYLAGDIVGAQQAASNAKLWCWISFGVGLATTLGFFGLGLAGAGTATMDF